MSKQQNTKRHEEELLFDKAVLAVSEKYIDALYYNEMLSSPACWNTAAVVDEDMKNLNKIHLR